MKFNWIKTFDNKEQNLIFYKNDNVYYPENFDETKKYGILNIIDYHFDGNKPTPYDLDNNESASLNSFFINAWDFFDDYLKNSIKNNKRLYCYYLSSIDCENFIYALSRYKPRKCILKNNSKEEFKERLTELFNFYTSRNSFSSSQKTYISDIDKKPNFYNDSYKVKIYLIKNGKEQEVFQSNIEEYFKDYFTSKDDINNKEKENYFEYVIENDFDIDSFGDVTNGISILFELFDSIRKTCISYLNIDSKDEAGNSENFKRSFNYYEEYFKLYFYKVLVEKYRTKNIEDSLLQELRYTDPGYENVIEKIYAKMNGKNGNLGSPNIVSVSKETKFNGKFNSLKIPFYKSNFSKNGKISFYIEKRHLPNSFKTIKNYKSLKDYFDRTFNEKVEQYSYENISKEEFQEYYEKNKSEIINNKIKELIYSVKPSFNFTFENYELKSKYEDKKTLIYKKSQRNFKVEEFNDSNAIEFGREFTGKKVRDYAKITIINPYLKNIEEEKNTYIEYDYKEEIEIQNSYLKNIKELSNSFEDIDLGSGYLNVQQFEPLAKDNVVTNFFSSLFEFDKAKVVNVLPNRLLKTNLKNESNYDFNNTEDLNVFDNINIGHNNVNKISKSFIIKTEEVEELPEEVSDGLEENKNKNNKISVHHKYEDFVTPLEDKEITISHLSEISIGSTKDLEWCSGYSKNGYIEEKKNIPDYKKTNIYIDEEGRYLLDVTDFIRYNNAESIKQIEVIDFKTGKLYSFISGGIREQTYLDEYSCIELENDNPYIDNSVLYNYIVGKIENHSLELSSIESNSVKIKIPKNDLKTFAYGEMIVLGSEVDSKISNIIEENDNYLILELNLKSGTVVNRMRTITKKSIILKNTENVKEYLNSLKEDEGRNVYISSFTQREGNADIDYISDIKLVNNKYTGEEFVFDINVGIWGAEVNINHAEEINIEEK